MKPKQCYDKYKPNRIKTKLGLVSIYPKTSHFDPNTNNVKHPVNLRCQCYCPIYRTENQKLRYSCIISTFKFKTIRYI